MPYTLNQSTTGLHGSYDDFIYVVKDTDNVTDPKYRYACQVTVGSTIEAILLQLPNNANAAVFNLRNVIAQAVKQDEDILNLGKSNSNVLSTSTDAFRTISLDFGYSKATSADTEPTITLGQESASVEVVNGNFTLATTDIIDNADSDEYVPDADTKYMLSDIPVTDLGLKTDVLFDGIAKTSWATLAFLNNSDSLATHIGYRYYNGTTVLSTTVIENSSTNGGQDPSSASNDGERLIYVAVGTANLSTQLASDINPGSSTNNGWTHYEVVLGSAADAFANPVSQTYKFYRLPCTKFQSADDFYTVHWWNSKGGIDNLVFSGLSELAQNMERTDFRQIGGNSFDADGDGTNYVKYSYEGGKTQSKIRTTTTLKLNTAFGNPDELAPLMMSLLSSERVYITPSKDYGLNANEQNTYGYVRGFVSDNQFMQKSAVKDGLSSYEVNIEVARKRAIR